jgi:hypothetical protein
MRAGRNRQWGRMLVADQLEKQHGLCPICTFPLFERYAVLDRFDHIGNFTAGNIRALHVDCEALVLRRRAAGHAPSVVLEAAE